MAFLKAIGIIISLSKLKINPILLTVNMEQLFLYLVPFLGILGLVVMAVKSAWVTKQPTGDENMVELAGYIAKGAMSFLKAEWKVMGYFVVIAAIILGWSE